MYDLLFVSFPPLQSVSGQFAYNLIRFAKLIKFLKKAVEVFISCLVATFENRWYSQTKNLYITGGVTKVERAPRFRKLPENASPRRSPGRKRTDASQPSIVFPSTSTISQPKQKVDSAQSAFRLTRNLTGAIRRMQKRASFESLDELHKEFSFTDVESGLEDSTPQPETLTLSTIETTTMSLSTTESHGASSFQQSSGGGKLFLLSKFLPSVR